MKLYLLVLSLCLFNLCSISQSPELRPYIDVEGSSEKEIMPDEIFITITLMERMENREKVTLPEQEEALIAALKNSKLDTRELSVAEASGGLVRIRWRRDDVLSTKDYILRVRNAEEAGRAFEAMKDLKIRSAYISRVWHTKMDSLHVEMHKEAIRQSKNKAGYLLAELNKECGDPILISEKGVDIAGGNIQSQSAGKDGYYADEYYDSGKLYTSDIAFRKIKLAYRLNARYLIQ